MEHFGERRGSAYDDVWWRAVHALFDEAFPGLPDGIRAAAELGAAWPEVTTPFAMFEGSRCVAHVGVLRHPMMLDGAPVEIAGVHAVCTAADRRGLGLCRELLARALAWADRELRVAKLHTDAPEVYRGHGFRVVETARFCSQVQPRPGVVWRALAPDREPDDAALLARLLAQRMPVSRRCASLDPGWMVTIVAALSGRTRSSMRYLPEHDAIVVFDDAAETTVVVEVIAADLPEPEVVLGAAPTLARPAMWSFCPDRLEPSAPAEPAPRALGAFMVRGDWPLGEREFGISPLWEH